MRVLVTGGHGFIGSHTLQELIENDYHVGCFDVSGPSPVSEPVSDDVHFFQGDIADPIDVYDAVATFEPDRIIHLASKLGRESQTQIRPAISINLMGTVHVLEAADSLGVDRVIAASSASTYGDSPLDVDRLTEETIQQPSSVYGLTKYAVERVGQAYADQRSLEFAAIRPTHGLGPDRQRGNVEDTSIIKAAVSGTPLTIPRIEYPIEIIYVRDEARAFVAAAVADDLPYDNYIIGTGEQVTLVEVTEMVRELVPDAELKTEDIDDDNRQLFERPPSDYSRIREDFGWKPEYSIEDSIEEYITWLQENPNKWSFSLSDVPWLSSTR